MQKYFLWTFLTLIVLASFNISVSSFNGDASSFLFQTSSGGSSGTTASSSGAPAMDSYVIIDGPGAGTVIVTTMTGSTNIAPTDNPLTKASGSITGVGGTEMNCSGPLGHFHGTLRDAGDPDGDGCGWGHAALLNNVSMGIFSVSDVYMKEIEIINKVQKNPPDFMGALDDVNATIMDLQNLQGMVGKRVGEKLGKAIMSDTSAAMILDDLSMNGRDAEKETQVIVKINKGLEEKQKALMIVVNAENMVMGEK